VPIVIFISYTYQSKKYPFCQGSGPTTFCQSVGEEYVRYRTQEIDAFKIIPYLKSFLHITTLYSYVWQIPGKLKEAVIQDHGNTEYDSRSTKYDNYITQYSGNSKDHFSLHYVTFPRKKGRAGSRDAL
jgi:hypothetical protein